VLQVSVILIDIYFCRCITVPFTVPEMPGGFVQLCKLACVVNRGADTLIQQAQGWESKGEYLRAIECYARVTTDVTSDQNVLQRCWVKVSDFLSLFVCCLN